MPYYGLKINVSKFSRLFGIMPKNIVCFKNLKQVIKLLNISKLPGFNFKQFRTYRVIDIMIIRSLPWALQPK